MEVACTQYVVCHHIFLCSFLKLFWLWRKELCLTGCDLQDMLWTPSPTPSVLDGKKGKKLTIGASVVIVPCANQHGPSKNRLNRWPPIICPPFVRVPSLLLLLHEPQWEGMNRLFPRKKYCRDSQNAALFVPPCRHKWSYRYSWISISSRYNADEICVRLDMQFILFIHRESLFRLL